MTQTYWQAVQTEDWVEAARIIREYDMPYFDYVLNVIGGFDAALHGTFEHFGLSQRWRRPPYHSLTDEQMEQLSQLFLDLKSEVDDQAIRISTAYPTRLALIQATILVAVLAMNFVGDGLRDALDPRMEV